MEHGSPSEGSSEACPACASSWDVYYREQALAINVDRHSALYRCSTCGAYYEVFPEERQPPKRLGPEELAERFPGYRPPDHRTPEREVKG